MVKENLDHDIDNGGLDDLSIFKTEASSKDLDHDFDDGYDDLSTFKTETSGKDLVNDYHDHIFF